MSEVGTTESELEKPSEGESLSQETFSIFILKSQAQAMVSAEQYLRNRKWIVGSASGLKEALAYIIQKQPQYVFLSADHTHKKIRVLPKLLAQAFPCRVIGFAERGGPLSMSVMNEMALEYNLYPPVSGPAIQRLILKIKKDDELKAKGLSGVEGTSTDGKDKNGGNDIYTFKNDHNQQGGSVAFDARSALTQLLAEGGDSGGAIGAMSGPAAAGSDGSAMMPGHYNPQQQGGDFSAPNARGGPGFYNPQQQGGSASPGAKGFGGPDSPAAGDAATSSGPAEGESFADWAERMRTAAAAQRGAAGGDDAGNLAGAAESDASQGASSATSSSGETPFAAGAAEDPFANAGMGTKKPSSPVMESDYKRQEKKRGYKIESDPRYQEKIGNDSIIVRGTQQALDETMNLKGDPAVEIEKATNVACILIHGMRFSGYLICAMGADRKVDQDLMKTMQTRLLQFLRANGEEIKDDEVLGMKIQEVDFQDWALEQADFLRKSVHEGEEVAMAFFPANNINMELEESASKKMLQMRLEELREDSPLEFDLYIYMPENNKYLLYTPQGKSIYDKQKLRLKSRGVTHMHLKKESLRDVKRYRAQNFLNDKIASYKSAQKMKSSNS
jgi:hypothetical protein